MGRKTYKTQVTKRFEAFIDSDMVAHLMEDELDDILGGTDRYIDGKGRIMEDDYRSNFPEFIRDATAEEQELYASFMKVIAHFKKGGAKQ